MEQTTKESQGESPDPLGVHEGGGDPWSPFFAALESRLLEAGAHVVYLSGAEHVSADARFLAALGELWSHLRARALPVHLVLSSEAPGAFDGLRRRAAVGSTLEGATALSLNRLTVREVAERVPGWRDRDVLAMYGLLGGLPSVWDRVDPEVRPSTNLVRLFQGRHAPVRALAQDLLRGRTAGQPRSHAVLHALANGATSWGDIRRGAHVFRSSSEVGPYVKLLTEQEAVGVRSSLDAAPGSRARRYHIREPLLAFWLRCLAERSEALDASSAPHRLVTKRILPCALPLVREALPRILESFLKLHGDEVLPGRARETGALWGAGYDIPVAGTLSSGAAVYCMAHGSGERPSLDDLGALRRQLRETRYGFDREARLLLVLSVDPPSHRVAREFARDPAAFLLTPAHLLGR